MKVVYFDFGEARILYGSAASMILGSNEVYIIRPNNKIQKVIKKRVEVVIGNSKKNEINSVEIIEIPVKFRVGSLASYVYNDSFALEDVLVKIKPHVIITGSNNWFLAKKISKNLKIPLIFWDIVVPSLFKLSIFIKDAKIYSRLFTAPIGFIHTMFIGIFSDYIITNDIFTESIFKKMKIKTVRTVLPTYTKFVEENAYAEFLDQKKEDSNYLDISTKNYVMSLMTIDKSIPTYRIELKSLDFLKEVAIKLPDMNFVIVGASILDLDEPDNYINIKNIHFLGKIYDDLQLSQIYKNAKCVLCPLYVPGFMNRLFEAFFYGKAIIATLLPKKYYPGLSSKNILFVNGSDEAAEKIEQMNDSEIRKRIENGAIEYYNNYFSPEKHKGDMNEIFTYLGVNYDK